jgi:hypothetical protein
MINLVFLSFLTSKSIYWNSCKPECLESYNFSDFCYFHANNKYWFLQAAALSRGVFPVYKTNYLKPSHIKRTTFTFCDLYYLLAYASPEVVKHIAKASADITVDILVLCLVTLVLRTHTWPGDLRLTSYPATVEPLKGHFLCTYRLGYIRGYSSIKISHIIILVD